MPPHVFTRQALYERVWAEPIRILAPSLGLSDVGLTKVCRAAGIPTPPRGWWAKLQHGKPLPPRPPLPDHPNQTDRVVIVPSPPKPPPSPAAQALAAALAKAEAIPPPKDLRHAHPIVRSWIDENLGRRREARQRGWGLEYIEDLTSPLAQRRLRLTSAVLKALDRKSLVVGTERGLLTATDGDETLRFALYERGKIVHRPATEDERRWDPKRQTVRATVPAGDLVLKIRESLSIQTEFKELTTPLEGQLPAVVASIEAGLEALSERRRFDAKRRADWAAAEAERRRETAYRQAEEALGKRLLDQAERHRQAETIRAYIAATDASPLEGSQDYAGWRAWALAEADALDPLLDGSAPFDRLPPIEDWAWRG